MAQTSAQPSTEVCDKPSGEPIAVTAVSRHLELRLADGRLARIAGIEPVRPTKDDPLLAEKALADLKLWTTDTQVALTALDATADRWGRVRARVFLAPDHDGLAGALIAAGWARVDPLSEAAPCLAALLAAETEARTIRRGLWADPAYQPLDQSENPDFSAGDGRIALVSGEVVNVNTGRNQTFINLGRDRRKSLTLTVSTRNLRAFSAAGLDLRGLTGKTVRARGLIKTRFGPRLELHGPGALEILGEKSGASPQVGWHPAVRTAP